MVSEATYNAFYEGKRTDKLPFVANDVVTVKEGKRAGKKGWVTSIQSEEPTPTYLVEYEDGCEETLPLAYLQRE